MMQFEKYPDPDQLEWLREANERAAQAREERLREAAERLRHRRWVLIDTAKQTLGLTNELHVQPGEEWALQNVRLGLESLIKKLEEGWPQ